jgi:glutamate 5-kinase
MKQSTKKKTQSKKSKVQQERVVFNGTLVGTWKDSDIVKITLDSGAMIAKLGSDNYKFDAKELQEFKKNAEHIANRFGITRDKVVVINV